MKHEGNSLGDDGRVAGSFRDPSGYVFLRAGRVFRAIDDKCRDVLTGLADAGLLAALAEESLIVESRLVDDAGLSAALAGEHPGFCHFLEHQPVWPITFPYEWTVSMLADAGVRTIDLQLRLLAAGFGLKDASAYNIQFASGRPTFIDLGSIERPRRLDLWYALGQFQQMFLFPLLLCGYRGWDLRSCFLANLGGCSVEQAARAFGRLGLLRPGLLLDVTLPLLLTRLAEKSERAWRETLQSPHANPAAQVANLRRLRSKIARLASGRRLRGPWLDYDRRSHYGLAAEEAKRSLVGGFLRETRPRRVVDLGCNTGQYSRLAAECGAEVVAVDADHDAVELLYRRLRREPAAITPLVIDLGNPSPALGFMNRERPTFLDRVAGDCVLALALLHHLLVAGNLSLNAACELLAAVCRRDLVLEFVPAADAMFQRLLKFRTDRWDGLSLPAIREAFGKRFSLLKEEPLADSGRTLLFFRFKNTA